MTMATETKPENDVPTAPAPAPVARPLATVPAARPPEQVNDGGAISAFASESNFIKANRMAVALSNSSLVPDAYKGSVANCLIAIELASRINASIFAVMQNLDIIHGRPGWRSTFLIATVNASSKFSKLKFRWYGTEGKDDWGCRAVAKDREDGEVCVGALITIAVAKSEGWYNRSGSKWKTIPEQMLMYRAAAFWSRVYCPELSLGMQTAEEAIDAVGTTVIDSETTAFVPSNAKALEAALMGAGVDTPVKHDADGVVVVEPTPAKRTTKPKAEAKPQATHPPATPSDVRTETTASGVTTFKGFGSTPETPANDEGRDDEGAEAALGQQEGREREPGEEG